MPDPDAIPSLDQLEARQPLSSGDAAGRWLARSEIDRSAWMLRQLPADSGLSRASVEAMLQAWAQLQHPAFLRPWVVGEASGKLLVWRPWIETRDSPPHGEDQALAAAQRIAEALNVAHAQNLVHGRLSPGNVLVTPDGGVKLTDFSLSRGAAPADDVNGLGQLLCGWLTGQTPVTRDPSVIDASLAGYARDHDLPPQLGRLLHTMLCQPEAVSMRQVRDRIDDVRLVLKRAEPANRELWAVESYANAEPAARATRPASGPSGLSRSPLPWLLVAAAVVVLLAGVFWIGGSKPALQEPLTPVPAAATAPPQEPESGGTAAVATAAALPPSQYELEMMLRQRDLAQDELDAMINLQLELEEQQAELWAPQALAAAVARAREGDEPFRTQQFAEAADIYADAHRLMRGIAALRPLVVGEALERGRLALAARRSAAAQAAYSLALAIEPDHPLASAGLQRAQSLDELLDLLSQAQQARSADQLEAARDLFQQAAELDASSQIARQGLAEARQTLVERDFRRAMSDGLAALASKDWQRADTALQRAKTIRPGARAPADALVELARQRRDASVASVRVLAQQAVEQERWEAAIKHFDDLLARDKNLKIAQEGRLFAVDRLDLDKRLLQFNRSPASWWSANGRSEARSLLLDAQAIDAAGPRLQAQVDRLDKLLALAEQPVSVTLQSDNACDVVVYKVARLGRFDSHQLRLLPGRYTAVGTRDGYRDVRRDFVVPAGTAPRPVELRCEEQVLAGG